MRRVALGMLLVSTQAYASLWTVTGEGGAEVDTNVQRVETGPGLDTAPVSAPVLRLGAKLQHGGRVLGGGYGFALSDLTRLVVNDAVAVENVTMLAGDAHWLHPLGARPVSA